jgi:integrase
MKFTDRKIKNLKPGKDRYEVWEGNGLGIRVAPSGRKSWIFIYRFEGKARRMTIGVYPTTSVAEAHKAHGKALVDLDHDIDPGAKIVSERKQDRDASIVKDLMDEYLDKWAKPRKRTWQEDERMLEKDVIPAWGRRKAKNITRRDAIRLIDGIVEKGSPIVANRTLEIIRKMFNFAVEQDIIETSPCVGVRAPGKETQRDRILTESEIRNFWNVLDRKNKDDAPEESKLRMALGTRLALKLQLLTAQRRGEVATAEIAEFDLDTGWWTIPGHKSKNGLSHRVPLSPQSLRVVKQAMELAENSPFLFPSPRSAESVSPRGEKVTRKSIKAGALTRAINKNRAVINIDNFSTHDLRRTAASMMTAMGISRLVVSKILNHVESGITAVYDRHSYDQEKRQALDAWGRQLDTIIKGKKEDKKIVELKRA